jgi:transposase
MAQPMPFDTITRLIVTKMGQDIEHGDFYVFMNVTRRQIMACQWDGTGFGVYYKRIVEGKCAAPWTSHNDGVMRLSVDELLQILEGCEWTGRVAVTPSPPASSRGLP